VTGTKRKTAGAYKCWSAEEDERLLALCHGKVIHGEEAWWQIAEGFPGRSRCAVQQRHLTLRMRAAGIKRSHPPRPRPISSRERKMPDDTPPPRPVFLQHYDLTAAFFGDPLPGRSALDQKRGASA
jgi:hypothetical protein